MYYRWLRVLREILPSQKPDRLGVHLINVFNGLDPVLQVPIDPSGGFPGDYGQPPKLPAIDLLTILQGQFDLVQGCFKRLPGLVSCETRSFRDLGR